MWIRTHKGDGLNLANVVELHLRRCCQDPDLWQVIAYWAVVESGDTPQFTIVDEGSESEMKDVRNTILNEIIRKQEQRR